jgi:hypothetical protein
MDTQRVIVYVDGFNFYYFPPNHHSNNLAMMANGKPVIMSKYRARFNQSLLPDIVHLKAENYDLHIPDKWKSLQGNE